MRWSTVSTLGAKPPPRCQHTATWLNHNSKLVIIAGQGETVALKDVWSLDCSVQPPRWKEEKVVEHSSVQIQRSQHTAVEYKGKIYIFGGQDLNEGASLTKIQSNFIILSYSKTNADAEGHYDCASFSNFKGTMPLERYGHSAARIRDKMFIFGGTLSVDHQPLRDLHLYDFIKKIWTKIEVDEKLLPQAMLGNGQSNTISLHAWPEHHWYIQGLDGQNEEEQKLEEEEQQSHDRVIVIGGMYEMSIIEIVGDTTVWRKVITPEKPPLDAFRSEHGSCLVPEHGSDGNTKASIVLMGGLGAGASDTIKKDLYQTVVSVAHEDDHQSWNERTASGTLPDNRSNHSMTLVQLRKHEDYISKNKSTSQPTGSHLYREKLGASKIYLFGGRGKTYMNDLYSLELDGSYQFKRERIVPNSLSDRQTLVHQKAMVSCIVNSKTIITHGGYLNSTGTDPIDQMCEYDIKKKTWSIRTLPNVAEKKHNPNDNGVGQREGHKSTVGHTLSATQNENDINYGIAYLFGGGCYNRKEVTNQFFKYDVAKNSWEEIKSRTKLNPKPPPRAGHSATIVGKDKSAFLCIIGGFVEDKKLEEHYGRYSNDIWVYKIAESTWHLVAESDKVIELKQARLTPRMGHSACSHDNDTIYCFGGSYNGVPYDGFYKLTIKQNDDKSWSNDWKKIRSKGKGPSARTGHSACIEVDKWQNPHMYIVGGRRKVENGDKNIGGKSGIHATERSNDIYIYDVNSNTWTNPVLTNANVYTKTYLGTALAFDHSLLVFSYTDYNSITDENMESDHIQLSMLKLEKLIDTNSFGINSVDDIEKVDGDVNSEIVNSSKFNQNNRFSSSEVKKSEFIESKSMPNGDEYILADDDEISEKNDDTDGVDDEEKDDSDGSSDTGTGSNWTNDTGDDDDDDVSNENQQDDTDGNDGFETDDGGNTEADSDEDFEDY
jgi:hypothetical protein